MGLRAREGSLLLFLRLALIPG